MNARHAAGQPDDPSRAAPGLAAQRHRTADKERAARAADTPKPPPRPTWPRWWYYRSWLLVVAAMDVAVAVTYLTGPVNSTNLLLAQSLAPMLVWSLGFAVVGGAIVARWYLVAGIAGGLLWAFWAFVLGITVFDGTALSAAGLPLFGGLAAQHALITFGAATGLIRRGAMSH